MLLEASCSKQTTEGSVGMADGAASVSVRLGPSGPGRPGLARHARFGPRGRGLCASSSSMGSIGSSLAATRNSRPRDREQGRVLELVPKLHTRLRGADLLTASLLPTSDVLDVPETQMSKAGKPSPFSLSFLYDCCVHAHSQKNSFGFIATMAMQDLATRKVTVRWGSTMGGWVRWRAVADSRT